MLDAFIPAIDYCSIGIHFSHSRILLMSCYKSFSLYDREIDQEFTFETREELAQKAKTYLHKHEVTDFKISGFSLIKE